MLGSRLETAFRKVIFLLASLEVLLYHAARLASVFPLIISISSRDMHEESPP